MIIGISGKIGSGKDTVGQIIQYLTLPEHEIADFTTFMLDYNNDTWDSPWEIRKFADKLKDIVCMLIGCTRTELENRDFKEAPLGEEWKLLRETSSYGAPNVIYPADYKGMTHIAHTHEEVLTPRKILQLLGTDCGREIIHPNIWVNSLMADYKPFNIVEDAPYKTAGVRVTEGYPNWLVTDTRFPNEADSILNKNGILIRVNRGDGNTGNHPSETALDNYDKFTYVINNNGSFEDLIEEVRKILIKEKLI